MVELEFTVMADNDTEGDYIQPLLKEFEKLHRIKVNLAVLHWDTGWSDLVKYAIYNHGPDISEVGTSWIGSLASMNGLRPFPAGEIRTMGGAEGFLPTAWNTGIQVNDPNVWSIPWRIYANLMFYRKDWLEKIGVEDADAAFASHETLEQTLDRLRENGIPLPWAAMALKTHVVIHEAASWIWAEGGDYLSFDHKRVQFEQAEAFLGLHKYYSLRRFLSPDIHLRVSPFDLFYQEKTAAVIGGPWLWRAFNQINPAALSRWGTTQVPGGVPYMGGSGLVVWKHTNQPSASVEFVRFLLNNSHLISGGEHGSFFPSRLSDLKSTAAEQNPLWKAGIQALGNARSFPTSRLWGLIEENLMTSLNRIWNEVISDPSTDIDAVLHRNLDPLARRMNVALAG